MYARTAATAAIVFLGFAGCAEASPITYTEQVLASGTFDGQSFTNAQVTLTGVGDTSGIFENSGAHIFINSITATVEVAGLGSDTFTDPIDAVVQQSPLALAGFSDANPSSGDILDIFDSAFASYGLGTPIGPITDTAFINSGLSFPTSGGSFVLNSTGTGATFTAVPEPSSFSLVGMGLLSLICLLQWRQKVGSGSV